MSFRFESEFKRALSINSAGFNLINDEEFLLDEIDLLDNDFSLLNNEDGMRGDTEINRLTMPRLSAINSDLQRDIIDSIKQEPNNKNPFL